MRIGVICGGFSSERTQSEENGLAIAAGLREIYDDVVVITYSKDIVADIHRSEIDFAFVAVQGKHHGDGTLQGILELLGIPYSGSKANAAAIMNNKIVCKQIWTNYPAVTTPAFFTVTARDYARGPAHFSARAEAIGGYPVVAKPVSEGASIGIEWIKTEADFEKVRAVLEYDPTILIEKFIPSRYLTQPVITVDGTPRAFPAVEAISLFETDEFKKYNGEYDLLIPELPQALEDKIRNMSLAAFESTDAVAYARVDYALSHVDGEPYLLEINGVPGMTDHSLIPYSCQSAGLSRPALLDMIVRQS